jgi:hypothetical protein
MAGLATPVSSLVNAVTWLTTAVASECAGRTSEAAADTSAASAPTNPVIAVASGGNRGGSLGPSAAPGGTGTSCEHADIGARRRAA